MKNIIIAVLVAFIFNVNASANPVIMAELQKMESASIVKDNQIADLLSQLANKDKQLTVKDSLIAELKNNPDLDQALRVKFNSVVAETKTKLQTITDEVIAKLKKGEK